MKDRSEPTDPSRDTRAVAPPVDIEVRAARVIRTVVIVCVALELLMVVLDYFVNYGGATRIGTLRRLTNITREDSLASWIGTTQTTLVAVTLWGVWAVIRRTAATRRQRVGWLVIEAFFTFMAADDGAMLHERAGTVFHDLYPSDAEGAVSHDLGARVLQAFPSYAWQVVALPFFVGVGLFILAFLWRELADRRSRWIVFAALACFGLAVALDFIEGLDEHHPLNLHAAITRWIDFGDYTQYRFGETPFETMRHFSKSIEEFLEMLANTLFWYVFLGRLVTLASEIRVRFVPAEVKAPAARR